MSIGSARRQRSNRTRSAAHLTIADVVAPTNFLSSHEDDDVVVTITDAGGSDGVRRQSPEQRRRRRRRRAARPRSTVVSQPAIPDPALPTALVPAEVDLLKSYVTQADEDGKRFYAASDRNRRRRNVTNFFLLLLLWATSGGSIIYNLGNLQPAQSNFVPRIIFDVLLALAAIMKTFQQVYRYDEKVLNYEMTGDALFNYSREWRVRIAQGVDDRRNKCEAALIVAESRLSEIENNALPL